MKDFEELMKIGKNKDNFDLLIREYQNGKEKNDMTVIPFIGAGLSAFCYPTWKNVLQQLIDQCGGEKKNRLYQLLEKGEYENVADILAEEDEQQFYVIFREIYGYEKIYKYMISITRETVSLLPFLFPSSLIITTNFDPVIECIYDGLHCATPSIFNSPNNQPKVNNAFTLFKIHGDIFSDNNDLVFTKKTYERFYHDGSRLVKLLEDIFRERSMLFLGASLNKDRTLDVLQKVHSKKSHFAIVQCENNSEYYEQRSEELHKQGILPIFYPKNEHEWIYTILSELISKVNPSGIIHGLNGERFFIHKRMITRVLNPGLDDHLYSFQKNNIESIYSPRHLDALEKQAKQDYEASLEHPESTELAEDAAEEIHLLIRNAYFGQYEQKDSFYLLDMLKTLADLSQKESVIDIYSNSLLWDRELFSIEKVMSVLREFQRLSEAYARIRITKPLTKVFALRYSFILTRYICISVWSEKTDLNPYIKELKRIYEYYSMPQLAVNYAEGLVSVILKEMQDHPGEFTDDCEAHRDMLKQLVVDSAYNDMVIQMYSGTMLNWINSKPIEAAENIEAEVAELYKRKKTERMSELYAQAMFCLSLKYGSNQSPRVLLIKKIEEIARLYPQNLTIQDTLHRIKSSFIWNQGI